MGGKPGAYGPIVTKGVSVGKGVLVWNGVFVGMNSGPVVSVGCTGTGVSVGGTGVSVGNGVFVGY
jgi:hypothetical protein